MKFNLPNPNKVLLKQKKRGAEPDLAKLKSKLIDVLTNFNIGVERIATVVGSRVILFKVNLSAGTKVAKLKQAHSEIAIALSADTVRIQQLTDCIGIEIPHPSPSAVSMLECITNVEAKGLPIVLGKQIDGTVKVVQLNEMPHLLVAGATGQGKSVFINALLSNLLMTLSPADMRLILIDPKRVELGIYNDAEAYLLKPVIVDAKEAMSTLKSLCFEMDDRYNLLKDARARNIDEYNAKASKLDAMKGHRHLPYIVTVIDEFADLMLTGGKEAETSIVRLAQLARAVGIHLVVATQRPSTDIISGLIKANFPVRIAFRTTSNMDSRTILDCGGAEDLLGNGDMLYSKGTELIRVQCPFISTDEVSKIVEHVSKQKFEGDEQFLIDVNE